MDDFCRAISSSSPASIQVCVIPKGIEAAVDKEHDVIFNVLEPLKILLLKAEVLKIRDAKVSELPNVFDFPASSQTWVSCLDEVSEMEQRQLLQIVESNAPVEHGFEMHAALLKYCQSFERCPPFNNDMALWEGEGHGDRLGRKYNNPYKGTEYHSVERGLQRAKNAAEADNDVLAFKVHRENVLMYLERQYGKINNCSNALLDFIKEKKRLGCLFHPYTRPVEDSIDLEKQLYHAKLLLDDYAMSFEREAPTPIKIQILREQRFVHLPKLYDETNRGVDVAIRRFNTAIDKKNNKKTVLLFQKAVDTLDNQLIRIRQAGRDLFEHDLDISSRGVDIHPCDPSSIDHVVWDVEEPEIGPNLAII
ncbi:uncharacterized protein LY89DRAFT_268410 [Mollisia scopiformis]|uniref:Uncharacterized protein n=1 Tax=Mollisia scopiformis TaxID=149040 RepID=A0A132BCD3_MOLSC|nr:uncharacterized protein LY89DRAFT_268410 [Mollisia scopiformis]KUJ10031.1 hypothetical protein LY89DRAFT_268410 [Mollisia scopiformis]